MLRLYPFVAMYATPRKTNIPPRVTIIEGTRKRTVSTP